jgi:hypothetical protein
MIQPVCNILIDALPDALVVDGRVFPISTSFRTGILFEQLIIDSQISDKEKLQETFRLFFIDDLPRNIEEATEAVLWFYRCGLEAKEKKGKKNDKNPSFTKRIYDYDIDAPLIYAAFVQQYGIDLSEDDLHWWKFSALFKGLDEECEISKIMGYRGADLSQIKNRAERKRYASLQAKYALPSMLSSEEKVMAAGAVFGGRI